ncbi:hypothetical protein F66182_2790 [Fusarium sp. NRRL 66182]|nr:hypothetical protein F66182_2790 [Fusarium sp. NRRL 66182]
MDGVSVAASCVALIQAADKTLRVISQFARDCKDAQTDLANLNQELSALTRTLSLLKDLVPDGSEFADSTLTINTKRDIRDMIHNSLNVARDIEKVLLGHEGRFVALSWAARGRGKVATHKAFLETNRRALSLAVDTITLATTKTIKHDTANILDDTTHIKGDIGSIMSRIRHLEGLVSAKNEDDPRAYMLRRYLNDLSSVAGSVCDMSSRPASPDIGVESNSAPESIASSADDLDNGEQVLPKHHCLGSFEITPDGTKITCDVSRKWGDPRFAGTVYDIYSGNMSHIIRLPKTHKLSSNRVSSGLTLGQLAYNHLTSSKSPGHQCLMRHEILNVDASIFLLRTSRNHWKVHDRHTDTTLVTLGAQAKFSGCLPITENCVLFILTEVVKLSPTKSHLFRVRRIEHSNGKKTTHLESQYLPLSGKSAYGGADLFTFSLHDRTITALGGYLYIYAWRLDPDWFVDKQLTNLPTIGNPSQIELPTDFRDEAQHLKEITRMGDKMLILEHPRSSLEDVHKYTVTSWDLSSGVARQTSTRSHVVEGRFFWPGAKLSSDGKLLMVHQRLQGHPEQIEILQVSTMSLVQRFDKGPPTSPSLVSTPNFDVVLEEVLENQAG